MHGGCYSEGASAWVTQVIPWESCGKVCAWELLQFVVKYWHWRFFWGAFEGLEFSCRAGVLVMYLGLQVFEDCCHVFRFVFLANTGWGPQTMGFGLWGGFSGILVDLLFLVKLWASGWNTWTIVLVIAAFWMAVSLRKKWCHYFGVIFGDRYRSLTMHRNS